MPISVQRFGPVTVARAGSSADLRRLLVDPWLGEEKIIVKPNWVENKPGVFTDCETLRMVLEAIEGDVTVVEGYQIGRSMNILEDGMSFDLDGREVNWRWLMAGGWSWLEKNPDWGWFREGGHWDHLREEDNRFLDEHGFTDLFEERGVEYVNVTEEVWAGRTADPGEIKEAVEARLEPVATERLYSYVPQKLHDLRGATLVNFAKVKHYPTFTLKNMFGLIPDPLRAWWHGPKNSRFSRSVADINKVYMSLFKVYGICEALRTTAVPDPTGEHGVGAFKYGVANDLGVVAFGRDQVSLSAVLCGLLRFDFKDAAQLEAAEGAFGAYDRGHVEDARTATPEWFPFRVK
ncbi:MAG: DUF362 domain-containing protein [Candidatus Bathyarchaeota archaeon]|nr:DUF362 domain-containing protein [Candidatus Bathyarchaeota archaeon]